MDKKNIMITAIAILLFAAGAGTRTLFTPEEFEHAYVCSITEEVGLFYGGISGTGLTGYPNQDSRAGRKLCKDMDGTKGVWIPLIEYAEQNGLNPLDFIIQEGAEKTLPDWPGGTTHYECSTQGCTKM